MDNRQKWELKLTILTIIGMLVSGFLSGFLVFKVTSENKPLIVVSKPIYDNIERTLNISISNFRNYPAFDILVYYHILGLEDGGRYIGDIPSLFKETKHLSLNLFGTDSIITRKAEEWFLSYYKENNSVKIQESKDYVISGLGFNVDYKLQIIVSCNGCGSKLPEPHYYKPNVYCRIEKEISKCDIRGSTGF